MQQETKFIQETQEPDSFVEVANTYTEPKPNALTRTSRIQGSSPINERRSQTTDALGPLKNMQGNVTIQATTTTGVPQLQKPQLTRQVAYSQPPQLKYEMEMEDFPAPNQYKFLLMNALRIFQNRAQHKIDAFATSEGGRDESLRQLVAEFVKYEREYITKTLVPTCLDWNSPRRSLDYPAEGLRFVEMWNDPEFLKLIQAYIFLQKDIHALFAKENEPLNHAVNDYLTKFYQIRKQKENQLLNAYKPAYGGGEGNKRKNNNQRGWNNNEKRSRQTYDEPVQRTRSTFVDSGEL